MIRTPSAIVLVVVLVLRFKSEYDLPIYERVRNGTHCGNIRASKTYSTPGAENALKIGGSLNALLL
jgi:hypothetical protein